MTAKPNHKPLAERSVRTIALLLALLAFGAYWRAGTCEFVNLDDNVYVYENPVVTQGLTWDGVKWAFGADLLFRTKYSDYWMPLTILSRMLDVEMFGLNPTGHHLVNVMLHAAGAVLTFVVLARLSGALWPSAFAAALFAVHPLHVESVAWVTERKDVLSTVFWWLTIWAYAEYRGKPTGGRYALILLPFTVGLLTKPMLITLPCVLLLLDVWPLRRIGLAEAFSGQANAALRRVVLEKVPLLLLSAGSLCVTFYGQRTGGAMNTLASLSVYRRLANVLNSYVLYIAKAVWPQKLAVMYPWPAHIPAWQPLGAAVILIGLSVAVARQWRTRPYLLTGWLWFIGTLVPVIGIVHVGPQTMADRFVYVPIVGLYMAVSWTVADMASERHWRPERLWAGAAVLLAALAVRTHQQLGHWQDSVALFSHALDVTEANPIAHNNLGEALVRRGAHRQAAEHFHSALTIRPDYRDAHANMGAVLLNLHNPAAACTFLQRAVQLAPELPQAQANLGHALRQTGNGEQALVHYQRALELDPGLADVHNNVGTIHAGAKAWDSAIRHFSQATALSPGFAIAHVNLARALQATGQGKAAVARFETAIQLEPNWILPVRELCWLLAAHPEPAVRDSNMALQLAERLLGSPAKTEPAVLDTVAAAFANAEDFERAIRTAQTALEQARTRNDTTLAEQITTRLTGYRSGQPHRLGSGQDNTEHRILNTEHR